MAQEWYLTKNGREKLGPYSLSQLQSLAKSGTLSPHDHVRRDGMTHWMKASSLADLFPASPTPMPPSPVPAPATAPARALVRIKNLRFSKKTITIASILGACLLLCCGGVLMTQDTARKQLAKADGLWNGGNKAAAAGEYRKIIDDRNVRLLKEEDRPRLYGRLIDFEFENGRADSGKKFLETSMKDKILPSVEHPEAKVALASFQEEQDRRLAEAKARQEAKQEAKSKAKTPIADKTTQIALGQLTEADMYRFKLIGKSGEEVLALFGKPNSVGSNGRLEDGERFDERWKYYNAAIHKTTGFKQTVVIFFTKERVIGWDIQ